MFLQNVTLSLAYEKARSRCWASGHQFRNGIKCWQSFCPCLSSEPLPAHASHIHGCAHRLPPVSHKALGHGLLHSAVFQEKNCQFVMSCSKAASPGKRENCCSVKTLLILHVHTFWSLKTHLKYLRAVISQNSAWPEYQNMGRLTVKPTPQNYPGKHWILRLKIMKS